jgi:hypothetical protein
MDFCERIITPTLIPFILNGSLRFGCNVLTIHLIHKSEEEDLAQKSPPSSSTHSRGQPTSRDSPHFTFRSMATIKPQAFLFLVARRPPSRPARAAMPAPVHVVTRYFTFGYVARTKSIVVLTLRNCEPGPPPGTVKDIDVFGRVAVRMCGVHAAPVRAI